MIGSDGRVRRKNSVPVLISIHVLNIGSFIDASYKQMIHVTFMNESLDYQVTERTDRYQMRLAVVPGPAPASAMLSSLDVFQRSVEER